MGPLVEGVDFQQFMLRVRHRLLQTEHSVTLHGEDGRTINSIERLLEVDESSTLLVAYDSPSSSGASATEGGGHLASLASRLRGSGGASPATLVCSGGNGGGSCRVDIPVSEWARGSRGRSRGREQEETGDLKYRKRRGGILLYLRRCYMPIFVI